MARKRTGAVCNFCKAQGLAWWHDPDKANQDGTRGGYRLTLPKRDPVTGEPEYATQSWRDKTTGVTREVQRLVPDTSKVHRCLQGGMQQGQGAQGGAQGGSETQSPDAPDTDDDAGEDEPEAPQGAERYQGGGGGGQTGDEMLDDLAQEAIEGDSEGKGSLEGVAKLMREKLAKSREAAQAFPEGSPQRQFADAADAQQAEMLAQLERMLGKGKQKAKAPESQAQPLGEAARKAQELAKALQAMAQGALDEERVREIAREEAAKGGRTKTLKLKVQQPGRETQEIDGAHPLQAVLVAMLAARIHVYLYGPRGSGKTTGAQLGAKALSLRYGYMSLNPQTSDSRVNGFLDANGVFRDTVFFQLYSTGGVMCIDEMDHASGNILTALNGAIENGHANFPCGMVERHPDFVLVATGNTPGRGPTPDHPERRGFDGATGDRFAYLYWPYDLSVEENAALAEFAGAGAWITWVRSVREYAALNDPRLVVSPRASIMGAKILASGALDGISGERARQTMLADAVVFKGWDKDTVKRIMAACPMPDYQTLLGAQGA